MSESKVELEKAPKITKKSRRRKTVQYDQWGYFFIAPFFIVYIIFSLIPLLTTVYYSFFEYYRVGLMEVGPNWFGLKNYIGIFNAEDNLAKYFWNTLVIWVMGFVPQIVVSLILAVWFTNTELRLKCQQFFKTVIYMPNLIMAAAFSMLFFALFSPAGPISSIITKAIDRTNMPNCADMISKALTLLDGCTKNNPNDLILANAAAAVIDYLKSVVVPQGMDLATAVKFINDVGDNAVKIFRESYTSPDVLKYVSLISNTLSSTASPMEKIRFFSYTGWSRTIIATMNFLMWYGNTTILLMAGVMGIDNSLFEAARIDGATPFQIFFKITIPLLLPIFVYVLITSLIGGIQMFDVPQILTKGDGTPNRTTMTIIMKLNRHLENKNYGPAGATSVLVFAVTAVLSGIVYRTTMSRYTNKR